MPDGRGGLHRKGAEGSRNQEPSCNDARRVFVIGVGEDLDSASDMAIAGALPYLQSTLGIQMAEAVAVASLVVNLRITQIANGVVGVHALIKRESLGLLG